MNHGLLSVLRQLVSSTALHADLRSEVEDTVSKYLDENSALTDAELHTQTQSSRTSFPQSERRGQHDEEYETTDVSYSETRQEDPSQQPAWDAVRDELESDRQLLESLIGALRVAHPQQIRSLVNLFQGNVPQHDVRFYLDETFPSLDSMSQLDASTGVDEADDSGPSPRKHRYRTGRIQDLMNPPLAVPAKPWTTVTDNDDFVELPPICGLPVRAPRVQSGTHGLCMSEWISQDVSSFLDQFFRNQARTNLVS
ncbi:hypothetical protein H2198_005049 [Neophaeococcomyces mojaviensis]|uniref:Uncharacterized protein n=1 Tax=Neophaeococcomyces mojaviensis TaxID=3383035 RepID=A0ACC3A734_9EURO|nr:hypothetical protein H2198_005049 [Knufia sp. JES_112]